MEDLRFRYSMLDRLRSDCDYFLGNGHRNESRLWAGDVVTHIAEMKRYWLLFEDDEKPEWLTWEQILDYEYKMAPDFNKKVQELYHIKATFEIWRMSGVLGQRLEELEQLAKKARRLYYSLPEDVRPGDVVVDHNQQLIFY
ncbi:LPD11 domain-containing protein [Streptococcus chenjunshii]|uniref:LPD11 domain-containing protein n=1 Tax=Streptococcus chenjunshii TaxID=2173853 RepID=UPI0013C33FD4|nr:LPD11 domain-containing protein [Streptococcus chenjunshii]